MGNRDLEKYEQEDVIQQLLSDYYISRDKDVCQKIKTEIVSKMIPVVRHIARTIARRAYDPVEDLVQSGFIGLLKAIDNYSKVKNNNFRIYAGYSIIGEMRHYLRDKLNTIRVPAHIQELVIRINNFTKDLTLEELEMLTKDDVAAILQVPAKTVEFAMEMNRRRNTVYLEDLFVSDDSGLGYEELFSANIYDNQDRELSNDDKIMFNDAIKILPKEEKEVIEMYYNKDMPQKDIAKELNYTEMKVGRIIKRACKRIYNYFEGNCRQSGVDLDTKEVKND